MTDDREQKTPTDGDGDLDARLEAFDTKVKEAGSKRMPEVPDWSYTRPPKQKDLGGDTDHRSLGIGITAAYMLVGGMVFGYGIGWLIDRTFHTSPLWAAVLGLLGTCVAVVGVLVMINRGNK